MYLPPNVFRRTPETFHLATAQSFEQYIFFVSYVDK